MSYSTRAYTKRTAESDRIQQQFNVIRSSLGMSTSSSDSNQSTSSASTHAVKDIETNRLKVEIAALKAEKQSLVEQNRLLRIEQERLQARIKLVSACNHQWEGVTSTSGQIYHCCCKCGACKTVKIFFTH
jgi:hypothetical protein